MGKETLGKTIVILGGSLIKDRNGKWRSSRYGERGDNFGEIGGNLRVIAAAYLFRDCPNSKIIASGGKGQFSTLPGVPTLARIIRQELRARGVPAKKILLENRSRSTFQQLQKIQPIIERQKNSDILIVSNQWHLPRIRAMISKQPELKSFYLSYNLRLVSAEKIVLKYERKKWKKVIEKAFRSKSLKARLLKERQGVRDIMQGNYYFK